jgi:hypothetical protein
MEMVFESKGKRTDLPTIELMTTDRGEEHAPNSTNSIYAY